MTYSKDAIDAFNRAADLQQQYWDALGDFEIEIGFEVDGLDEQWLHTIETSEELEELIGVPPDKEEEAEEDD